MSTTVPDQSDSAAGLPEAQDGSVRKCERCGLAYQPEKSTSSLRLTYCSFLCELGHLGFSISGLEHMERTPPADTPAEGSEDPD